MAACHILNLSNELLREVLDHIEADPEKLVSLERRAYLSHESFRLPPNPPANRTQDIRNFRLSCKRFSDLGAIHQFAQVTIRFCDHGFERLEYIASQRHLAEHVLKFAYMVPFFYVDGRDDVSGVLNAFAGGLGPLDATCFARKAKEQKLIRSSERDLKVLKRAFAAFKKLQHVQILRLVDREDSALLDFLRQNAPSNRLVDLKWSPACSHSIKTLALAMASTNSPCTRFSSPMMSGQSLSSLTAASPRDYDLSMCNFLAAQITSLELHFDDPIDLDAKMRELSPSFRNFFYMATGIQSIHVGFPSHRPLGIPLEDVFHHVRWPKLVAFGIQAWKLDAKEIIGLARRFQDRLRGLRLRDILLAEGSMWKDVLTFLREDMSSLLWVSLRRIGYAKHFDEQWAMAGVEVPDDPPGGDSETDSLGSEDDVAAPSDSDPGDEDDLNTPSDEDGGHDNSDDGHDEYGGEDDLDDGDGGNDDDDGATDNGSVDGSQADDYLSAIERGRSAHEMEFPRLSPDRPEPRLWCTCDAGGNSSAPQQQQQQQQRGPAGAASTEVEEDIYDDGVFVSNAQRKMWEKWVMRRCPQHSRPPR